MQIYLFIYLSISENVGYCETLTMEVKWAFVKLDIQSLYTEKVSKHFLIMLTHILLYFVAVLL